MSDDDQPAIATNDSPGRMLGRSGDEPAPTRVRTYSPQTRAAFAQKFGDEGTAKFDPKTDSVDDLEPAIQTDNAAAEPGTASPPAPLGSASSAAAPSAEAAALDAHRAEQIRILDERERALSEKERARNDLMERFKDDPAHTIQAMLREAHGIDKDGDVRAHAMDLVTDLSGAVLGLEVPESVKTKAERRKAERLLKEHRAELAKRDSDFAERTQKAETEQRDRAAQTVLAQKLQEKASAHPNLMQEEAPHLLVWETAKALVAKDPNWVPSWEDAAKRAETHLASKNRATYDRLRKLYESKAPPAQARPTTQDGAPGSRAPVRLTNEQASEASGAATSNSARPMTNADRRAASLAKLAKNIHAS